jgi:uncharacterized protein YtpQ (UPF0354 family)
MMKVFLTAMLLCLASPATAETPRPETLLETLTLMQKALQVANPELNIRTNADDISLSITLPDGTPMVTNPDNLHIQLQAARSGEERDELLQAYVAGTMEAIASAANTATVDLGQVRPVLRNGEYATLLSDGTVPFTAFPGDLVVYWVIDAPSSTASFSDSDLAQSGLTPDALSARALDNLRSHAKGLQHIDMGGLWMLRLDGYYESSVMLLPEVWIALDETLGTVVAAPISRDVVVYGDGDDPAVMAKIRETAARFFADFAYAISPDVFRWNGTGWEVIP